MFRTVILCVCLALAACGNGNPNTECSRDNDCQGGKICRNGSCVSDTSNPPQNKKGYTSCGEITCQPGQYCQDQKREDCDNGCLSDENCAEGQTCKKGSIKVGNCVNTTITPNDSLAYCRKGCDQLQKCELFAVAETATCHEDCKSLTESQRKAFGDCATGWSCISIPACLSPVECGGKFTCPSGQTCVAQQCL